MIDSFEYVLDQYLTTPDWGKPTSKEEESDKDE